MAARTGRESSTPTESVYVVSGDGSTDVIARSLQALLPTRHHPVVRQRFTVLDTFDGRVRRAGARLILGGDNGICTITCHAGRAGRRLSVRLTQPVSFAWDLPDGPLRRLLASVIGVRRLLAQAEVEEREELLEILDDRRKTVARLWIESGQAR